MIISKNKRGVFLILFVCLSSNIAYSQCINSKDICEYSQLINSLSNDSDKKIARELYLQMIGATNELCNYRNQFLSDGKLINLFPTAYFHTTLAEMENLRMGIYKSPIVKLEQMIYFFDAYKFNRLAWEQQSTNIEPHWKKYYETSNYYYDRVQYEQSETADKIAIAAKYSLEIRASLDNGITAHVDFDLPRAIRFAFNGNTYTSDQLNDFNATDIIFSNTVRKTNSDIATALPVKEWILKVGGYFLGKESEVKNRRKISWNNAFNQSNIVGIDGKYLINQPLTNHSLLQSIGEKTCPNTESSTLLLFDVSGSMSNNNKWQNAKQSALSTLATIKSQAHSANLKPSISIRAFDGECIADPTRVVIDFTTNLSAVEDAINNKVPPPGGGTPLPQSIQVSEEKLKAYLAANNIRKGKLIVLTDGLSSCGSLRPQGVYGYGQQGFQPAAKSNASSSPSLIHYYAIGFDIAPGSEAERDLQYLVQTNGGKYLNAQNQVELTEAFYKFNKAYIPKPSPAVTPENDKDQTLFDEGLTFISDEEYDKALENYKAYIKTNDKDYNGIYNFALMSEANEKYKAAIKNYELYLQLYPNASDKPFVLETLQKIRETAKRYAAYNKQVVKSDMEYIDLSFKQIQNGESIALAIEFIGFLKEKYFYYQNLAAIVEVDDRLFKANANEVFKGLKECVETINRNPRTWDRDATPVLSRTYLNMERLYNSF